MAAPTIRSDEPLAKAIIATLHAGDVEGLHRLLRDNEGLAMARIRDPGGSLRTPLHVLTDWPGNFPRAVESAAALLAAGAEVGAPFTGAHVETPLHWAASCNDVAVLDALLDAGADIEAPGAVIGGGTPLADAVAFAQWEAARRLVERGARTTLWQAAALGLLDRVEGHLAGDELAAADLTNALWCACHGRQQRSAEVLLARGADLDWIGHDRLTPLDAAIRAGAARDFVDWLRGRGAHTAQELRAASPS